MKLSAYIVKFDAGFSPNPFGRYCTLACCKPGIRRHAKKGDIIVGTASNRYGKDARRLIYAMKVGEVVPYEEYWEGRRFQHRKYSSSSAVGRRGDNIWRKDANGDWQVMPGACHDERARIRDTGGKNALVATEFYYFGRAAIRVPRRFQRLLAKTQGHKNTRDMDEIKDFWDWVRSEAPKRGRIDDPFDFTDDGCRAQCGHVEREDIEEPEHGGAMTG